MGEAFITRRGGGGGPAGLNFRVIGGTSAPSNPKENDIWVNTSIPVSSWVFSADAPGGNKVTTSVATKEVYLNSSGVLTSNTSYSVSGYTEIPANTTHIMVRHSSTGSNGVYHEFSNASKQKISVVARAAGDITYEVPANAKYVRLSLRTSAGDSDTPSFIPYTAEYDGMVWISTGVQSSNEFNALKKNGIQVYPISAKQYVSGAWVDKTAKSYQHGEWVDWSVYIFDSNSDASEFTVGYNGSNGKANFTGGKIVISYTSASGSDLVITKKEPVYIRRGSVISVTANFTNFQYGSSDIYPAFGIAERIPTSFSNLGSTGMIAYTKIKETSNDKKVYTLKLDSYEGEYYFVFYSAASAGEISEITAK